MWKRFYAPNFLSLEKSTATGLYVKCIPLRGSSSCSRGSCNSNCSPNLSCYRRVICAVKIFHFDFPKVQFFLNKQIFNVLFANSLTIEFLLVSKFDIA